MLRERWLVRKLTQQSDDGQPHITLDDGSHVAVIGGGPAGSYFSYFLLDMAARLGVDVGVDIYEPRDFTIPGPQGCNYCGGIISETLVQTLAAEGINLPPTVIQRGIDGYVLHMDVGSVRIETPLQEMRIGAVHRGAGPLDIKERERRWESHDGFLLTLALQKGAHLIPERVIEADWDNGRPRVKTRNAPPRTYDLLAVAAGVNSAALKLFKQMATTYQPPHTIQAFIREYYLGTETIDQYLGSSMHVFLLNIPRLKFAAVIPKGDYATVCMIGEEIDMELFQAFLDSTEVRQCMPAGWHMEHFACQCSPRMNIQGAIQPFADRLVFVGDCAVNRLYKDGIGGAYRAAKAAAATAIFEGVSEADFSRHYWPTCKTIDMDNAIGKVIFRITREIQKRRFARRAMLHMVAREQDKTGASRHMSKVLWDMFTGSAPYQEILLRTLQPAFVIRFLWELTVSAWPFGKKKPARETALVSTVRPES